MQNKSQSKSRLAQYCSTKEFDSLQEHPKKMKQTTVKSTKKVKMGKGTLQSQSKGKQTGKTQRGNENFNSVNLAASEPVKTKNNQYEHENLKKQIRCEERLKRNSSEKLIKTKSVSKLQPKSGRKAISPSPICIRQLPSHHEEKGKKVKNATSRSEKERKTDRSKQQPFLKKSGSKQVLPSKFQQGDRSTRNRGSIKTQMSSKTHSVIKEEDRSKRTVKANNKKGQGKEIKSERTRPYKMPKPSQNKIEAIVQRSILYSEVSFQQFNGDHPYESAFISNDKYYLPYPDLKSVKTQGCQVQNKQGRRSIDLNEDPRRVQAAIKIQKVARGYITRKYIDQAKYIIGKAIIIQRWWVGILKAKKERLNQKIVSSSNSLITIKDFNDTLKTQKLFSESKENAFSNRHNLKELIRNVLEENEESDISGGQQEKNVNISREVYVELKIKDEILSERKFNFNSPKSLGSPCSVRTPTSELFNIRDFLGSGGSNQKQKIKEIMTSPRVNSPQQLKNTPQKPIQQVTVKENVHTQVQKEIEPFQTNFAIIEEFCLLTVNYFRDRPHEMDNIIAKFNQLKMFRTSIILKTWNSNGICEEEGGDLDETLTADFQYLQAFQKPQLFSKSLRQEIIRFPQIEIDLLGKRFNLQSPQSAPVHRAFLEFVFDVMEQAFYEQNKTAVLSYGMSMSRYIFESRQSLFQHYFSSALGELFRWGEVMCGLVADLPPEQQFLREQRMKEFLKFIETWDMGDSYKASMKIEASESIVMLLVQQLLGDMVCFL